MDQGGTREKRVWNFLEIGVDNGWSAAIGMLGIWTAKTQDCRAYESKSKREQNWLMNFLLL
jgi:hypothetical protein